MGLQSLSHLSLVDTNVSDVGLKHIAQIKNLKEVIVRNSQVTFQGWVEFQKLRPGVSIQR